MMCPEDAHGIDCPCKKCQEVRDYIRGKEESKEIYLSGTEEDKAKIRRVSS